MADTYTSYERVKAALEHREPDRVPFDLGGSVLTGMNKVTYRKLRAYLGLPEVTIELYDPVQQLARIHEDVLDRLKVDVRCADPDPPSCAPLAAGVVNEGQYYAFTDEWGITWKMPVDGGLYFDMRRHPLADADSVAEVEKFRWPDPCDPARFATLKQRADRYVKEEKRAYILGRHAAGIFEVGLWMRGFEKFFMDLVLDPAFADALLDKITELKMRYWEKALETVGDNVLVVSEADDIATQRGPMISAEMYRRFVAPRHKRLFEHLRRKARSRFYLFYHTCGAVRDLIPQLIEEGGGSPESRAAQRGGDGQPGAETALRQGHHLLGRGHRYPAHSCPRARRSRCATRCGSASRISRRGGGFVFNTVHNVQGDVPPENYMAMWEALQEYGGY